MRMGLVGRRERTGPEVHPKLVRGAGDEGEK
jgi:hypothetical protein